MDWFTRGFVHNVVQLVWIVSKWSVCSHHTSKSLSKSLSNLFMKEWSHLIVLMSLNWFEWFKMIEELYEFCCCSLFVKWSNWLKKFGIIFVIELIVVCFWLIYVCFSCVVLQSIVKLEILLNLKPLLKSCIWLNDFWFENTILKFVFIFPSFTTRFRRFFVVFQVVPSCSRLFQVVMN